MGAACKFDEKDMKRLEASINEGKTKHAAINEVEGGPKQEQTLPQPSK